MLDGDGEGAGVGVALGAAFKVPAAPCAGLAELSSSKGDDGEAPGGGRVVHLRVERLYYTHSAELQLN